MIEHIVLFRWTEGASQEAVNNVVTELRQLKNKIPSIVDLSCGTNFCDRAKGYTHGLVVRFFKDRAALDAYGPHPEHQRVVQKFIAPIRADVLAVDYEI
jgi:Stress responsive A/B Barrel Domain